MPPDLMIKDCCEIKTETVEEYSALPEVEPYLPGEESMPYYGRVPFIKVEQSKNKIPVMAIVGNIALILGVIGILVFYLIRL